MVFYLKINREQEYIFRNVQYWADIMAVDVDTRIILLCDKAKLTEEVLRRTDFHGMDITCMESNRDAQVLQQIVGKTCNEHWRFAAYAHLTTFYHAKESGYEAFWNIDADDTCFCLSAERARELLDRAQRYAQKYDKKLYSLDMWTTKTWGEHWSFGITYTDSTYDWLSVMKKHTDDKDFMKQTEQPQNVDGYLSYLKGIYADKMGTFYAENLRFIHYSDDFFKRPWCSGLFHWKEGHLILPILKDCFDLTSIGDEELPQDVDCLDIGITDQEAYRFLLDHTHKDDYTNICERLKRRGISYT